jgi:hypothetical protein
MSKSSTQQKYTQLKSWLSTNKKSKSTTDGKKESRLSSHDRKSFKSK